MSAGFIQSLYRNEDSPETGIEATDWGYRNDLELAAELGKSLLEQNRVLEESLCQQQQINDEQSLEVEFLSKQVEALRDLNESRLKIYEQLESNWHELELRHKRLQQEHRSNKQHCQNLEGLCERFETSNAELQRKTEEQQVAGRRWRALQAKLEGSGADQATSGACGGLKRSRSFDIGILRDDERREPLESEIERLEEEVGRLKSERSSQEEKQRALQRELECTRTDNSELQEEVWALRQSNQKSVREEMEQLELSRLCSECRCSLGNAAEKNSTEGNIVEKDVEHEHVRVRNGELLLLQTGGSVYGSRESLHSLVSGDNKLSPRSDEGETKMVAPDLLAEINAHYNELVEKYEKYESIVHSSMTRSPDFSEQDTSECQMCHAKLQCPQCPAQTNVTTAITDTVAVVNSVPIIPPPVTLNNNVEKDNSPAIQIGSPTQTKSVQTEGRRIPVPFLDRPQTLPGLLSPGGAADTPACTPVAGVRKQEPPEYRRLFREIYNTLQKSKVYEVAQNTQKRKKKNRKRHNQRKEVEWYARVL